VGGDKLLAHFGIEPGSIEAHAFTYLNFEEAARRYGKVGGFAHMKTLVDQLRSEVPEGASLLLDGGDTWQGSGTSLWTRGKDMVGACNRLGVDIMTGHWEFTYHDEEVRENIEAFDGEFIAQNVKVKIDALFEGAEAYNEDSGHAFKPYTIRHMNGVKVAVIGQAFPYTPIANPARFIPDWTFGIRDAEMQKMVDKVRDEEKAELVVVLSHNGMDVDLKMARVVSGIDVILGGHTHDGMPAPSVIENKSGKTLVTNAGSNGKFVGVMDLDVRGGQLRGFQYRLLPVFSNMLEPDPEMAAYVEKVREPYLDRLNEELAVAGQVLYRRGNFNGTFDQIICNAQREVGGADVALSPGFRWGTTVLPGDPITMENVLDQTATTYPETYVQEMKGEQLKLILEDVADNLFNKDPFFQQGGDMVRVGGLDYTFDPLGTMGNRVSGMRLDDGRTVEANKTYKVAGWATVNSKAPGPPVWEVVAEYLRDNRELKLDKLNTPRLKNVAGNPGIADYEGEILS